MDVTQITQPDIILYGLRIQEPMTAFTDLILGSVSFYAFFKLPKIGSIENSLMKFYFFIFGIGTFLAGLVGHAFLYKFGLEWRVLGWYASIISILALVFASLYQARIFFKDGWLKIVGVLTIIETLTILALTAIHLDFKFVEMHSVFGMILIFTPIHLLLHLKHKSKGSKYMLLSILVSVLILLVFRLPIVLHTYFNHKDLAHVIMCFSVLLILKGTQEINAEIKLKKELS